MNWRERRKLRGKVRVSKKQHQRRKGVNHKDHYKAHCRTQILAGLINDTDGTWRDPRVVKVSNGTLANIRGGYRVS